MRLGTKIVDKGLFLCEDWVLSIDFKLADQSTKNWNNLFGLQVGPWTPQNQSLKHKFVDFGNGDRTAGSHILAVWVQTDRSNVMLLIKSNLNNNPNFSYNTTTKFDKYNWINLKISQTNELYEIKVNYKKVFNVTNSTPEKWMNVNLVMGNTYEARYISAVGHYRKLKIITCPLNRKTLCLKLFSFKSQQ